ncbi:MAG: hypothetical protein EA408_04350 [Marinilabiliales bacterium]|nr:MAG: hypothetical protein EA408_04350 [Marinilabiliales bacterium]
MTITNQKQAVNLRIIKSLALLFLIIFIGLLYFANVLRDGAFGFTRDHIAVFTIMLVVLFFLLNYVRDHHYIYYSDTGDKFILRYFSLRPMADRKSAIEFNKSELSNYEITRSLHGLNKKLVIYRKTARGVAKYPPVSLTALSKSDLEKIMASMQRILIANRSAK